MVNKRQGAPRVLEPDRRQIESRASDPESVLPEDQLARLAWGCVERLDSSVPFDAIKARGGAPGRCAIDPRILFALWLYAVLDGVGSGREVARLCPATGRSPTVSRRGRSKRLRRARDRRRAALQRSLTPSSRSPPGVFNR